MARPKALAKGRKQVLNRNKEQAVSDASHTLDGNVFLTGKMLLNTLRAVHPCCVEDSECLEIIEIPEQRQGHFRCLKVKCRSCSLDIFVDDEPHRSGYSFRERKLDNRRFAFGADTVGLDFEQLQFLCDILDIPGPPDSYDEVHQEQIHQLLKAEIEKKFEENRRESWELHPKDDDGIAMIAVKTDGTYQKRGDGRRGYSSKVGIILLCDALTNKYLDYVILNKFCHQCTQKKSQLKDDEFELWQHDHEASGKCSANFEGASSEMERNAVRTMFLASTDYKLRYKALVGDGDTKAYLDVWDVYGCCDLCLKWQHLLTKRNSPEYEAWTKTADFDEWQAAHDYDSTCKAVLKHDCIQHVAKCFQGKLENLSKKGATAPDGKCLYSGVNRLGLTTRKKLRMYFNNAIQSHIRRGVLTPQQQEEAIMKIRRGIFAGLLDDEVKRHQYCPDGPDSWCDYKAGLKAETKSHHLDSCFEQLLLPIYQYYTSRQMLVRMIAGMNTNNLENTNSVLWSILGKAKYHGTRRTDIAVMLTIFRVEDGREGVGDLCSKLGIPISKTGQQQLEKVDQRRQKLKEKRHHSGKERYLRRLKEALLNRESAEKSYAPGFCDAGDGPSGDMSSSVPLSNQETKDELSENCFVVIPFHPPSGWYAARIEDVDIVKKKILLNWLHTSNQVEFCHKEQGDAGYEPPTWRFMSEVLCAIPPPDTVCTSRRSKMVYSSAIVNEVNEKYSVWKQQF